MNEMNETKTKFRLPLNLFDAIILLLALGAGAYFLWTTLAPEDASITPTATREIQYTILLRGAVEGTGACVQPGDKLTDTVKNFKIGTVVSSTTGPAITSVLDEESRSVVNSVIPGLEDVRIVVSVTVTDSDSQFLADGGYEIRVGANAYVRGPGYLGSGFIVAIEREGEV